MTIMSVSGPIEKENLGITSPHEHIFIDMKVFFSEPEMIGDKNRAYKPVTIDTLGVLKRNPFALLDNVRLMDIQTQTEELMQFKYAGGRTVVDATTVGIGRDPFLLREVAARTGLQVIAGAGFYVKDSLPPEVLDMSVEEIQAQIIRELNVGIGHSDVRAGIIGEVGISHIIHPFEERSLIASSRAQMDTGAPLLIHINPWSTQGIAALKIAQKVGVDPEKIVICHSDVENVEDYIFAMLDKGVFLEFDNFGKEMATDIWDVKPGSGRFVTDWERVRLLKKIIDRGYGRQLLFACDVCLKTLLHAYGGWGYDHVLCHIVPMLKEVGISEHQISEILIDNPASWLCG